MSEIVFLSPENLDFDKLIEENYESFEQKKLRKANLIYTVGSLVNSRINNRKQMEKENTSYAPLWAKSLESVVHNYKDYLDFLLDSGVFLTDNHFILGEKCRGYCFGDPYAGQPLKEITMNDYKLKKAIRREVDKYNLEKAKRLKSYDYLTKWWKPGKIKINEELAKSFIDEDCKLKIEKTSRWKTKSVRIKRINNAIESAADFKARVKNINNNTSRYDFHGDAHRFYNPFTNLKKELRQFATYDGKPLVEVDIKSCQPFLILALLNSKFWKSYKTKIQKRLNFNELNKGKGINIIDSIKTIITLVKTLEKQDGIGSEIYRYRKSLLEGTFYEYMISLFEKEFPTRFANRDLAKKEFLIMMYSNPQNHNEVYHKPVQAFSRMFPIIYAIFNELKKIDHHNFPLLLQRIESFLMLDVICKRIHHLYPHVELITIHDSIITTVGNEAIVEAVMKEEMLRYVGYEPRVGIKYLSRMNLAA